MIHRTLAGRLLSCLLSLGLFGAASRAAESPAFDPGLLAGFTARCIGPAAMGGRVTDVAVVEHRPATMYVATASGGLWKTVNNGTTWEPVFDRQKTLCLGAVAVAPSAPDVVWVGTGESNPRNSVSWGDGVYTSTDGGRTWRHTGLADTAHIGRIVIDPKDPDTVYVAALGHLWGPNRQRGLYKTTDGGKTWEQVKFINEDTGFIDLVMDPGDPATLYAAAWQCRRDAFSGGNPAVQTGPGSGLYKTTDAGKTWTRLTTGLPDQPLGRCGLDVSRKNPKLLYAVIQTDKTTATTRGQEAKPSNRVATGGVFRSEDGGETWTKRNDLCPRPFYYGQIRVDPQDGRRVYVLGIALHVSEDGGKTFSAKGATGVHADHHALWIDPHDLGHLVLGGDGGLNLSYDRGATWEHLDNMPIGQFYAVAVDMRKPYRVYGGLQDNGSWGGPSATRSPDGITNADWYRVLGADGFACQVDPDNPDIVYAETQFGVLYRVNVRTGGQKVIRPRPTGQAPEYRFNWSAPLLLSPHNPRTVYYAGNQVFRSPDRGEQWQVISPDLTRGKPGRSADFGHTITAVAESPVQAGLLYAGTDDGCLRVTRNGGPAWTDLSNNLPGLPQRRWVTRVECSHFAADTAYVTIDRHRNDDRAPYVLKTTDGGATWRRLTHGLRADAPVHVIREDPANPDLLFAGTELGLYVSPDGGGHWHRFGKGLPAVAVHDLVIHPRDRDLVVGTHGRSLYVIDIGPLEEMTAGVLAKPAHLFDIKPVTAYLPRGAHGRWGNKPFAAANPPYGAAISYYLKAAPAGPVRLSVSDALGNTLADLPAPRTPGLHRLVWDLNTALVLGPARIRRGRAPAGDYVARLRVGDRVLQKKIRVEAEE